ncbi:MAG: hypothetical protein HY538_05605 [Deltaproteobacteria bacterium]|nr:hypothetical protein [Deltaproteobacteria bacterium]
MLILRWVLRTVAVVGVIWLSQYLFDFKLKGKSLTITWNPNERAVAKIGKEVEKSLGEAKKGMDAVRKNIEKKGLSPMSEGASEEITEKDQEELQMILENK